MIYQPERFTYSYKNSGACPHVLEKFHVFEVKTCENIKLLQIWKIFNFFQPGKLRKLNQNWQIALNREIESSDEYWGRGSPRREKRFLEKTLKFSQANTCKQSNKPRKLGEIWKSKFISRGSHAHKQLPENET